MIGVSRMFTGTFLFVELVAVIALLKPFQQPCYLRDYWCKFKQKFPQPPKIVALLVSISFISTVVDICLDIQAHYLLLQDVNTDLALEFYVSKISLCYSCFIMQSYLLFLIEWLVHFSIRIARLLEFELMCRHAVLTKDETTQVTYTAVVNSNLLTSERYINLSDSNSEDANTQTCP